MTHPEQLNVNESGFENTESEEDMRKNDLESAENRADYILNEFGLDWESLEEKHSLDVGAGGAEFSQIGKKHGVEIIALDRDPNLATDGKGPPREVDYVKGFARDLPFKDEDFDFVFSHAAPPMIGVMNKEEVVETIAEIQRVLKPKGEFRFGPVGLLANIFTEDELFSKEEQQNFDTEERVQRVREKSLEFLQSVNPDIVEHTDDGKSYYSLVKKEK